MPINTTSFLNTPQAGDDIYNLTEDQLLAQGLIKPFNILSLDVMSNDLGGNAKKLFSIDDGNGNSLNPTDLLQADGLVNGVSAWEWTASGNLVRINNGKIEVDVSHSLSAINASNINALGVTDAIHDTFVYAIRLANGTLSWATVRINIAGNNDGPTASADSTDTDEDHSVTIAVLINDIDPDVSDSLIVTGATITNGALGSVTVNPDSTLTYDPGSAYNHLAAGDHATVQITYGISDGHGGTSSAVATVTITGTNDGPVAVADTAAGTENQTLAINVLANDTDVDDGHVFTLNTVSAPLGKGTASVVGNQVQFNPGSDFDHLAQGAVEHVKLSYEMKDEHGAIAISTVDVTVTGTNDAPVAVAKADAATEGGATINGNVVATDLDDGQTAALVYSLTAAAPAGLTFSSNGSYSFDPTVDAYDHLKAGATQDVVVSYKANDGTVDSNVQTLTITVTGTNDAPVAVAKADAATEGAATISGNVVATDVDDGTTLTYSLTSSTPAGLTFHADGSYSFDPTVGAYDHLKAGATQDVVVSYKANDGTVDSNVQTLTITVTGTNDAPVAVVDTKSGNEDTTITGTVATNDSDVDDGATLSYSLNTPVAGLVLNGNGSYSFNAGNAAYQHLAQGATTDVVANYTVTDEHGATNTSALTITLTGTNDTPDIRIASGDSGTSTLTETNAGLSTSGTLTVTDADQSDSVALTVASVVASGTTAGLGLTNAQLLSMFGVTPPSATADPGTLNNVNWSFNSGAQAFNYLGAGQSLTLTYTVHAADSATSDDQTVVVTINGTNDAATNLTMVVTVPAGNNSLPSGPFAQFTPTDPDGGGTPSYSMTLTEYDGSTLIAIADPTPDLTLSSAGVLSASSGGSGIENGRVYELQVTVTQDSTTYAETFSVFTGTSGGDTINSALTAGDDAVYVLNGADIVFAGSGDDTVFGQNAADQIHGGDGNDVLNGGGSNDTFVFDTTLNTVTNVDTVADFEANGNDHIALDASIFAQLSVATPLAAANFVANAGGVAADGNDYVLYDTATGNLFYDADGSGAGAKVLFATLTLAGVTGTVDNTDFTVLP